MARTMHSKQAFFNQRSHLSPVTLVKLTTYLDTEAKTTPIIFWFSDIAVTYDYGNDGIDKPFHPFIVGGGDFDSSLGKHVPDPNDLTAYDQSFDLHLRNEFIGPDRVSAVLSFLNVIGADIEVAQILYDNIDKVPVTANYSGTEHTVLFRGTVRRFAPITDATVTLQCETVVPSMAGEWNYAADESLADPADVGLRYPRIYGEAKRVPLVSHTVGVAGTLTDAISIDEDNVNIDVSSTAGLTGTFDLRIDSEEISCTVANATEITIASSGRAQNGTEASAHEPGAVFLEMVATARWIISDRQSDAVNEIYVINPLNGMLLRLENALTPHTITLNETIDSQAMTTLKLTAAQLGDLLEYFAIQAKAEVTISGTGGSYVQQPTEVTGTLFDNNEIIGGVDRVFGASGQQTYHVVGSTGNTYVFEDTGEPFTQQESHVWVTRSGGTASIIDIKVASVIVGTISVAAQPVAGSTPAAFSFMHNETGDITIDNQGSGACRVFNVERTIPIQNTILSQRAISADTNIGSENADELRDDDTGTGFQSANNAGKYFEVTFQDPGFAYDAQRLRFFAAFNAGILYDLLVDGVELKIGAPGSDGVKNSVNESVPTWHEVETALVGNTFRILQGGSTNVGEVKEMERDVIVFGGGSATLDATFGFGLRFFADVDGIEAPDGTYEASSGVVMTHPADILKHWITVVGGETVNAASETAIVAALVHGEKWGFDARSLGFTWEEILQRMAFEARCNVVPIESSSAREWHLLTADDDFGFPVPVGALVMTETHEMRDEGRGTDEISNDFTFRYAFDASLPGGGSEEGYRLIAVANSVTSDVQYTAASLLVSQKAVGRIQHGPIAFRCIQDPATALEIGGYLAQEISGSKRSVYHLSNVAWFEGLPLLLGEIVLITPPWTTIEDDCRVISMRKNFDNHTWDIVAIEILPTGGHP